MLIFKYWWIIPLTLIMTVNAYVSTKANDFKYFLLLWSLALIPSWALIAKFSKNIFLDALVYDSLVAIVYAIALLYFSQTKVSPPLIIGTILCTLGIILVAIK